MLGICLALLAAISYGASDFGGGLASRSYDSRVVNLLGQVVACAILYSALPFGGGTPSVPACAWGILAGLGSGVGTLALYRGLANGSMAVVAPLSAGVAAMVPVLFGFAVGATPALLVDAGVVVTLPAIVLISTTGSSSSARVSASARDGIIAGIGFAVLFIALSRTGSGAGLWPSAVSATTSLVFIASMAAPALLRQRTRMPRRDAVTAALAGVLGACGTTTFLLASRSGMLAVVSVIASLYPAVTVVLARVMLHERIWRLQLAGLGAAAVGVALIATG